MKKLVCPSAVLSAGGRTILGVLLLFSVHSCSIVQESGLYLNKTCSASGKTFVYYTDKYDGIRIEKRFQDGRQFSNGLASVRHDGKWGYIDCLGNVAIPYAYGWAGSFGEFGFDEDVAIVKNNTDEDRIPMFTACPSWLINKSGEKITQEYGIIFPIERKISIVNNGSNFATVGKTLTVSDGKWGAIDKKGKIVIPCEYDLMYPFREEMTFVQKNGKWGAINEKGKLIIPCEFDNVCYKSDQSNVDTKFDMSLSSDLEKTAIENQKENVIYMFRNNKVMLFKKNGDRL